MIEKIIFEGFEKINKTLNLLIEELKVKKEREIELDLENIESDVDGDTTGEVE